MSGWERLYQETPTWQQPLSRTKTLVPIIRTDFSPIEAVALKESKEMLMDVKIASVLMMVCQRMAREKEFSCQECFMSSSPLINGIGIRVIYKMCNHFASKRTPALLLWRKLLPN